ncbi:MAG: hypothetical protein GW859_07030 [Sphingomonadales bacterium]|nr:hypothetical protein [Sphingomonadales bacterium]
MSAAWAAGRRSIDPSQDNAREFDRQAFWIQVERGLFGEQFTVETYPCHVDHPSQSFPTEAAAWLVAERLARENGWQLSGRGR